MTQQLLMVRDITGAVTFGLTPSTGVTDNAKSMILTTNTEQNITTPTNSDKYLAIFSPSPGASVWVAYNGDTAECPSGSASNTTSENLPGSRQVNSGSQISFITSSTSPVELGVTFYAIS